MNTTHKVERKGGTNKEEPNTLIIKTSGSEKSQRHHDPAVREEMMKLTVAEEILIVNEMSRSKQCPQLIGVLEKGRVEEFRNMHCITAKEVMMPEYMENIAKAFARMHSLRLPLSKSLWGPFWRKAHAGFKNNPFTKWAKEIAENAGHDFSPCMSLKYDEEVLWLQKVIEKHLNARSRTALIQADTHYMNLVVNEEPRPGELNVYLMDYELCSYGPRGLDLGAHFLNKALNFLDEETMMSGEGMHTEEERRTFLKYYQDELRRLRVKNFDDQGLDSIDNLLFESYVGALLYNMYFTYIAVNLSDPETVKLHPMLEIFPVCFTKLYIESKKLAVEKYPFLDPKVLM